MSSNGWITFRLINIQAMARGISMTNQQHPKNSGGSSFIASTKPAGASGTRPKVSRQRRFQFHIAL